MFLFSAGFFHWILQRFTAIILFLGSGITFFFKLSLINYFLFVCLAIHLKLGVESLINDYCHDRILKLFSLLQLRLFFIYIVKFFIFMI